MNVLDEICNYKRDFITERKNNISEEKLKELCFSQEQPRGFIKNIQSFKEKNLPAIISEIKKKSPSKGIIRENFNPIEIAEEYENNNAACISILTDEKYFAGSDEYLKEVKTVTNIPLLRKDFMLDVYQIYEARALGADCILLIIACLDDDKGKELESLAHELGMDVLIEVHDELELEAALTYNSKLIGINNRNLKTMEISLDTSRNLSKLISNDYITVCESGIFTKEHIKEMSENYNFDAFLIGESLMKEENIGKALKSLIN